MNKGMICVSVCAETADEMIEKIKRAEEFADVIEVRFDYLESDQIDELVSRLASETPLIATFRSKERDARRKFWERLGDRFPWVDLEEDLFELVNTSSLRIVSFHDFSGAPDDLAEIYSRLCEGNSTVKIAVAAHDVCDAISVWRLIADAIAGEKNIIPIAMGEAGKWTRILGLAHGAFMTYASLDGGEETADGQITARDLIEVYRVKELDKDTAVYGVIGDPVSSSLSPSMHNAAFAAEAINAVFLPLQIRNLDEFIRRMVSPATREVELNFAGFSVTMPHKRAVMKHLDEIDTVAEKIGAVNTVKIAGGKLSGYNTDAHGFISPLKARFGDLTNARVAVLGAGGSARACVYALGNEGAGVTVFARDKVKAQAISSELGVDAKPLCSAESFNLEMYDFDIVVNATPVGMKGDLENESPLTTRHIKGVKFVYDLVARSGDTPLIAGAKKAGAATIDGLEMLVSQGLRQFEIWTGRDAPEAVMRQAVVTRLNR